MRAIPRSILVQVQVKAATASGAQVQWPDVPELNDCRIIGLEVYDDSMLAKTPNGQTGLAAADLLKAVVTIQDHASNERIRQMPLATLQPVNVAGIWKQFEPFVGKYGGASTVQFTDTPTATAFTIPFNVFYLPPGVTE